MNRYLLGFFMLFSCEVPVFGQKMPMFVSEYEGVSPVFAGASVAANRFSPAAASDGAGGYWVGWEETRADVGIRRLIVRRLPSGLNGGMPSAGDDGLNLMLSQGGSTGFPTTLRMVEGNGGVWAAFLDGTKLAVAFIRNDGAILRPSLQYGGQVLGYDIVVQGDRVVILTTTPSNNRVVIGFKVSGSGIDLGVATGIGTGASPQQHIFRIGAEVFLRRGAEEMVEVLKIDDAGVPRLVNEGKPLLFSLPAGAQWLGTAQRNGGTVALWTEAGPAAEARTIWQREVTAAGWLENGVTGRIGAVPALPRWQASPVGGLFILDNNEAFRLAGTGPLQTWTVSGDLKAYSKVADQVAWAYDGVAVLRAVVRLKGMATDVVTPAVNAVVLDLADSQLNPSARGVRLTMDSGAASSPSMAWSSGGPSVVWTATRTATDVMPGGVVPEERVGLMRELGQSLPATGLNKPGVSSPAHVWFGPDLALVVYRRSNSLVGTLEVTNGGEDDVVGSILVRQPSGLMGERKFVTIAGGPNSQRGVEVALVGDRALVAWREVIPPVVVDGRATFAIKAAFVTTDGAVVPEGGVVIDSGSDELSSVSVSANGQVAWRASMVANTTQSKAEVRQTMIAAGGTALPFTVLSPASQRAVGPKVAPGLTVWRAAGAGLIYARAAGAAEALLVGGSPLGGREPGVAALDAVSERYAIAWLQSTANILVYELLLATWNRGTMSPPEVIASGFFDNNTLSVSGDGQGRVALAVVDSFTGRPRIFVVAPGVAADGGLQVVASAAGLQVGWDMSSVFSADAAGLEVSSDLESWARPFTTGQTVGNRRTVTVPPAAGTPARFFRVRGQQAPGVWLPSRQ